MSTPDHSAAIDEMALDKPVSRLQQLELQHADEGQLTDIKRSDGLTTRLEEVESGYFMGPRILGSIVAIALAVLCVLCLQHDVQCFRQVVV